MTLADARDFIVEFADRNVCFFGPCRIVFSEAIDAGRYPEEINKFGHNKTGGYIISTKPDGIVRYVGIATNIRSRIYDHIGNRLTWARDGNVASFPECRLAKERDWQDPEEIGLLRNAQWEITGFFPDPPHLAALLEMAVIHYGKARGDAPMINIVFAEGPRPRLTNLPAKG